MKVLEKPVVFFCKFNPSLNCRKNFIKDFIVTNTRILNVT